MAKVVDSIFSVVRKARANTITFQIIQRCSGNVRLNTVEPDSVVFRQRQMVNNSAMFSFGWKELPTQDDCKVAKTQILAVPRSESQQKDLCSHQADCCQCSADKSMPIGSYTE